MHPISSGRALSGEATPKGIHPRQPNRVTFHSNSLYNVNRLGPLEQLADDGAVAPRCHLKDLLANGDQHPGTSDRVSAC